MKYLPSTYLVATLIHVYNYVLAYMSWFEIIMSKIQNEYVFIFFVMPLVNTWNGSWMVNTLACHHQGEGFHSLLWHLVHALKPTYVNLHFTSLRVVINKFKSQLNWFDFFGGKIQ
jgi:hypothetical protein